LAILAVSWAIEFAGGAVAGEIRFATGFALGFTAGSLWCGITATKGASGARPDAAQCRWTNAGV
jgi:hypothetical protein